MSFDTSSIIPACVGGVLIGLASVISAATSGKIPGISGMFSRVLRWRPDPHLPWRMMFFIGLLLGAALAFGLIPPAAEFQPVIAPAGVVLAGLLVGFGTRLGSGCTSGHGICGIGLGSKSSIVATLVFMAAGMLTVFVLKQLGDGGAS